MIKQLGHAEQERLEILLKRTTIIYRVDEAVRHIGGSLYIVGGLVRDLMLGCSDSALATIDIDVEIHGVSCQQLQEILSVYGPVDMVGVSFGVLRIATVSGIDWSIPRLDSTGRHPEVTLVPSLSITDALRRRDLTMNAMAIHVATGMLYDPFGGMHDLHVRTLRAPDPNFFIQDPLRFYRVVQAISRFEMYPDAVLTDVCKRIDVTAVSRERIGAEFEKLFLRAKRPSLGIRWLAAIGRLSEVLPELAATQGVLQDMAWHPEGDVFEHTMQAIDAAASLAYADGADRALVIYAALCHDLGKALVTRVIDGRIRSIGHDRAGVESARNLLRRIALNKRMIRAITMLVLHHMAPVQFVMNTSRPAAYKRLALALAPGLSLQHLVYLAYADKRARNPLRGAPLQQQLPEVDAFAEQAAALGVLYEPEPPVLRGSDIVAHGIYGPRCGALLKQAYDIQINESIRDADLLLRRVLKNIR